MKYKIIELKEEMIGKTLEEVKAYVEKEYAGQLAEDEDRDDFIKSNPKLSDCTWCYFFGSLLRDSSGHWRVPCVGWAGSEWDRFAYWLVDSWSSRYRVVLKSDSLADCPVNSDLTLETLNLRLEKLEKLINPDLLK